MLGSAIVFEIRRGLWAHLQTRRLQEESLGTLRVVETSVSNSGTGWTNGIVSASLYQANAAAEDSRLRNVSEPTLYMPPDR